MMVDEDLVDITETWLGSDDNVALSGNCLPGRQPIVTAMTVLGRENNHGGI